MAAVTGQKRKARGRKGVYNEQRHASDTILAKRGKSIKATDATALVGSLGESMKEESEKPERYFQRTEACQTWDPGQQVLPVPITSLNSCMILYQKRQVRRLMGTTYYHKQGRWVCDGASGKQKVGKM